MRSKSILFLFLTVCAPLQAQTQKLFGDHVVECLAAMNADKESSEFNNQIKRCERRVEIEIKKDEWHLCISKETAKLDDGISPASDIARAVSSSCETEFDAFLDSLSLSAQTKHTLRSDRSNATENVAIKIVLMQRMNAAGSGSPKKLKKER